MMPQQLLYKYHLNSSYIHNICIFLYILGYIYNVQLCIIYIDICLHLHVHLYTELIRQICDAELDQLVQMLIMSRISRRFNRHMDMHVFACHIKPILFIEFIVCK